MFSMLCVLFFLGELPHPKPRPECTVKHPKPQAPKASSWGTCETAKHRSQTASKTQPPTSLSEDLKTMYSQAPKASSWGTCETAKHRSQTASKTQPLTSLSEDLKTMYSQAPNVCESLVLGHLRNSQAPCISGPKRRQKHSL